MRKLMVVVSVMALLLCGAAMVAYAQGPEGGPHGGFGGPGPGGHGMGMALRELNLTDAQKAQVKTIMQANHANMKTVMQQMEQNRPRFWPQPPMARTIRRRSRRWPTSRPNCRRQ